MSQEHEFARLHDCFTRGEQLSPAENEALQNWYDEQDRAEERLLNQNTSGAEAARLRENLNAQLSQLSASALKVERIARQNESLRRENERLREIIENKLLEKTA